MTFVQKLKGNFTITDPDWPVYAAWFPGDVWTSDDFTGDGPLENRRTDIQLGGISQPWQTLPGAWETRNGNLKQLTGGAQAWIEPPHRDFELEIGIAKMPTAGSINFTLCRTERTFTSTMEQIIINIIPSGYTLAQIRKSGGNTTLGNRYGTKAGSIIRLRVSATDSTAQGWVDDNLVFEHQGHIPNGAMNGIFASNSSGDAIEAEFSYMKLTAL